MSSSVKTAPPKGRRSEGSSCEPAPAKSKKKARPPVPEVKPRTKRKKEPEAPPAPEAEARETHEAHAPEARPRADEAPTAEPRKTDKKRRRRDDAPEAPAPEAKATDPTPKAAEAKVAPAVDAKADTQAEAKVAQATAEQAEAKIARATDDRPRRAVVVVRGGSRGDGAQVWAILALAASVIGAAVAIGLQPPEDRPSLSLGRTELAREPVAAPPAPAPAPEPKARPARRPAAEAPAAAAIDADLGEAVETLLAAGRERGAIELLASARPSPAVTRARERVLTRSRDVVEAAASELRAASSRGEPSAPRLRRLRARLPESLATELDALAAELAAIERLAAAKAAARPAPGEEPEATAPAAEPEPEPVPVGPLAGRRGALPPRPEPTEPAEPEPARSAPSREPEPESRPEPEPLPEPAPPSAGGADEPSPEADAVLADALKDRLEASARVRGGVVELDYAFTSDKDRADWDGRGWDKFEINGVMGLATNHTSSAIALELGAGSNGAGVLQHALELAGDYTLEVSGWVAHSSARSQFVILAGKGGGVRWGTQLVKVTRGGGLKPLGPEPDRLGFRGERDVTIRVVRKGDTLEATLNGSSTGVKTFKPGELDGKVGLFAADVRLVITRFRITGRVDPRKL